MDNKGCFVKSEKAQGMVEYGLVLALVAIIAATSLGSVGFVNGLTFDQLFDKLERVDTIVGESIYTEKDTDRLIGKGYIPVATTDELDYLRVGEVQMFGQGTKWEGEYLSGVDKQYIQVADIDLVNIDNFDPIGVLGDEFKGIYDGGGYIINNLTIDKGWDNYIGLFGRVIAGEVTNSTLVNADVSGGMYVGSLVGYQEGRSSVINSYATGNVLGKNHHSGGLVGAQFGSKILNSFSSVHVVGRDHVGGLVGYQSGSSSIINGFATGAVSGGDKIGGLLGNNNGGSVSDSVWANDVNGHLEGIGHGGTGYGNGAVGSTKKEIDKVLLDLIK